MNAATVRCELDLLISSEQVPSTSLLISSDSGVMDLLDSQSLPFKAIKLSASEYNSFSLMMMFFLSNAGTWCYIVMTHANGRIQSGFSD